MVTERQAAKQRERVRRELERDYKKKGRAHLKQLRERIRHAKRWRSERLRQVRAMCRRGLKIAREQAKVLRAELRARAKTAAEREIEALRAKQRAACEARKEQADAQAADSIARAMQRFDAERKYQETVRRHEKPATLGRAAAQRRRVEQLRQSDDEVRANIPDELVPVWAEVKRKFKDEPRRTRTEAFLEWAAEHPSDVQRIADAKIEESIAELVREEARERRELERHTPRSVRRLTDADLRRYDAYTGAPEVPF
jgi:uncharacterized membrane protein YccC